jgi:hypothetical protein
MNAGDRESAIEAALADAKSAASAAARSTAAAPPRTMVSASEMPNSSLCLEGLAVVEAAAERVGFDRVPGEDLKVQLAGPPVVIGPPMVCL